MKQTIATIAFTAAAVQAKISFYKIDDTTTNKPSITDFLNKGGETLIAASNSGLGIYYQSILGGAQTIYTFNNYVLASPITSAQTWPAAVALVSFFPFRFCSVAISHHVLCSLLFTFLVTQSRWYQYFIWYCLLFTSSSWICPCLRRIT